MAPNDDGAGREPRVVSSVEAASSLHNGDKFLISTSEFVAPAVPIVYVKNKGSYLLFRTPNVSTTLLPEMPLWFKVLSYGLRAELNFKAIIYKIFSQGETAYPCLIVRMPSQVTLEPVDMAEGLLNVEFPMTWRRTGSMKRGTLKRLTIEGGAFETPEERISTKDRIRVTLTLGDKTTDELPVTIERITVIESGGNFIANSVEFVFADLSPAQQNSLQKSISETKASMNS